MKVSTPSEMLSGSSKLEEVINKFEEVFSKKDKDDNYYHLVIDGEYNREVCNAVENLYINAGWKKVKCRTTSENGERPGLTGLILFRDE